MNKLIAELKRRAMSAAEIATFLGVSKITAYAKIKALTETRGISVVSETKRTNPRGPQARTWRISE